MPYRIVQIRKPYEFTTPEVTIQCYAVEAEDFETPEQARQEIKSRADGKYPHAYGAPEDWFIIIQVF